MGGPVTIALVVASCAAVVAIGAVAVAVRLYARVVHLSEAHRRFLAALGQVEFPEDLTRYLEILGTVHVRTEETSRRVDRLAETLRSAVSRIGCVRFDAFDHMGGMMSFSVALLDHRGNGVLITGLHGRDSFDGYCRRIAEGHPPHELMPEESEALAEALAATP